MKRSFFILAATLTLAACAGGGQTDWQAAFRELNEKEEAIFADTSLTDAQREEALGAMLREAYLQHKDDTVGQVVFVPLITNFCTPAEALALYDESSERIKSDIKVKTKIESIKYADSVAPGKPFKEISGVDALSGEALNLSYFVGGNKPVLVDFWASWCAPCRREIRENLLELAASGKVQIVGIAVWEDSVEDTRGAMSELGITWPVIYSGGRENSPSVQYGVLGIPTLFLLSPEGTILASGHSVKEFADKL